MNLLLKSKSQNQDKSRKRWRQWLLYTAVLIFVIYLLAGFLILPLGVKFLAPGIAGKHIEGRLDAGWIWLNPLSFQLSAREISWEDPDGEEVVGFDLLRVNVNPIGSLLTGEWRIEDILLDGIRVDLRVDENGSLNIVEALRPRAPTEEQAEKEQQPANLKLPAAWLGSLELSNAYFSLTDLSGQRPFRKVISPVDIRMTDIHTGPERKNDYLFSAVTYDDEQIELSGSFYFNPLTLTGTLSGKELRLSDYSLLVTPEEDLRVQSGLLDFSFDFEANLLEQPLTAALKNAQVRLREMDLRLEGEYGASLRLNDLAMQNIAVDVSIDEESGLRVEAQARFEINDFQTILDGEQEPAIAFEQFRIEDARFSAFPISMKTGDIVLTAPNISIDRTETGDLVLMKLLPSDASAEESPPVEAVPEQQEQTLPELEIARFILERGSLRFNDASVNPAADVLITPIDLSVEPVTLSLGKPTKTSFAATVQESGSIQLNGELLIRDPLQATEATLTVRDLSLMTASPYTTAFIGRPVEEGSFSGDFSIGLTEKQLNAENDLRIQSIRLGETVSGYSGKTYPVGTAIALMENTKGLIEINVPVSGSLEDPSFQPFQVFANVLQNLVLKAATAPFNLAANMTGGVISGLTSAAGLQGDAPADYSRVPFMPGSAQLDDRSGKVLEVIADMLDSRPHIILRIQGSSQPTDDLQVLQEARFRERLDSFAGSSRTEKIHNAYKLEILGQPSEKTLPSNETTLSEPEQSPRSPDLKMEPEKEPEKEPEEDLAEKSTKMPAKELNQDVDKPKFYLGETNTAPDTGLTAKKFYLGGSPGKPPSMRKVVRVPRPVKPVRDPKTTTEPQTGNESSATVSDSQVAQPAGSSSDSGDEKSTPPAVDSAQGDVDPGLNLPSVTEMQGLLSELWFDSPPDLRKLSIDRARSVRQILADKYGIAPSRITVGESSASEGSFAIFHIETQFNETNEP